MQLGPIQELTSKCCDTATSFLALPVLTRMRLFTRVFDTLEDYCKKNENLDSLHNVTLALEASNYDASNARHFSTKGRIEAVRVGGETFVQSERFDVGLTPIWGEVEPTLLLLLWRRK